MKRLGNVWQYVIDENRAIDAIRDAIKYKRHHKNVKRLLLNDDGEFDIEKARKYAKYLISLLEMGTWKHKTPKHVSKFCRNKTNCGGKMRNLYIPTLEDHCIHHMLMQAVLPAFMKGMHPFSCGSVPNMGIKGVNHSVKRWLRTDKDNCKYFVKLDIRHFFDSIRADDLKRVIRRYIKNERILWGLDQIIDSAPVACPIGYYPSPWFANLLLQDLDWMIEQKLFKFRREKRIKYVKHYVRYMDDMLLIGTSKTDLYKAINIIKKYLKDNFDLDVKNSWEIKRVAVFKSEKLQKGTYWIDMCGYKFCSKCTILRNGIFLALTRMVRKIKKKGYATYHEMLSVISRVGWSKMANNVNLLTKYVKPYVDVNKLRRNISNVDKKRKWGKPETISN